MGAAKKFYLVKVEDESKLDIDPKLVIGRNEFPDDKKMSKRHCELCINENNIISIKDLNSKNKTWINDEPIPPGKPVKLYFEDKIKVGKTIFKLVGEGVNEEEADSRKSNSEFTFVLDDLKDLLDEQEPEEKPLDSHSITFFNERHDDEDGPQDMDTNIAHTMSKMVKTTFGIIKQRYSTRTNQKKKEEKKKIEAPVEDRKLELIKSPFRSPGKRGSKYKKLRKAEQEENQTYNEPQSFSGKPEMFSSKMKFVIVLALLGLIVCILLTTEA